MEATSDQDLIPIMRAAMLYRMSRDRLLRRVQSGQVRGELRDNGRWYVAPPNDGQSDAARD